MHDWTHVDRSLFHNFYLSWIVRISGSLNTGGLPPLYYSLTETIRDGRKPTFVELDEKDDSKTRVRDYETGLQNYIDSPPRTMIRDVCTHPEYAERVITIRRTSLNSVAAVIRIVTAETKRSRYRLAQFVAWAVETIRDGLSLLVVDPFRPGSLDPQGIHKAIWDEFIDNDFSLPDGRPLTLASYLNNRIPEAFVEPISVGDTLPSIPLFLTSSAYTSIPLEATYQAAWDELPDILKERVESPPSPDRTVRQ